MDSQKPTVREESLKIISTYFGEKTAKLYEKKLAGKTDAMISVMMRELLGEYLGQDLAEAQMNYLYKLIDNHSPR